MLLEARPGQQSTVNFQQSLKGYPAVRLHSLNAPKHGINVAEYFHGCYVGGVFPHLAGRIGSE